MALNHPRALSERFHTVLKKMSADWNESKSSSKILLPSENFIGTILGGQFQFGHLIRSDKFADVYEVTPLISVTDGPMEALAYDMRMSVKGIKRDISHKAPFVLCQIDQSGKKYLVYHVLDRQKHEAGKQKAKKKRREKQRKGDYHQHDDPAGVYSEPFLETYTSDSPLPISKDHFRPFNEAGSLPKMANSIQKTNNRNIIRMKPSENPKVNDNSSHLSQKATKAGSLVISTPKVMESHWELLQNSHLSLPATTSSRWNSKELLGTTCQSLAEKLHGGISGAYLKQLEVAVIALYYRSQACFQLEHEFRVVGAFVNFVANEITDSGEDFDVEWQMRKGWVPQCSSRSRVKPSSSTHLMQLPPVLHQPALRARLRDVAENRDLDEAICLRNLWAGL